MQSSMSRGVSDWPGNPLVYEINALPWLNELGDSGGRRFTLAGVPDTEIEWIAHQGFAAVWLMGVWERSPRGREIARTDPDLRAAYLAVMPDCRDEDVAGSPYSIHRYEVDPALGGRDALAALRERLRRVGVQLILDFVPNHLAVDHSWLDEHPERFVQGSAARLEAEPHNYFVQEVRGERRVFAHGRDPHFKGWTDTVQLDYRRAETRSAMSEVLLALASRCDGVRCDMAMLVMREVFIQTWGGEYDVPHAEFWPEAIRRVREAHPGFLMLAEVYWDLEYRVQQLGFDHAYDKRLYDRLMRENAAAVRAHLRASLAYQRRLTRFIENHDEPRAASAFGAERSRAAATLVLTLPGMRLVHDGQMEGRRLRLPVQLARRPVEEPDGVMLEHYARLLRALADPVFADGQWHLLEPQPAWPGNATHRHLIAHRWIYGEDRRLVIVNGSPERAQCRLPLDLPELAGSSWELLDRLSGDAYVRHGDEMQSPGLYVELEAFRAHLFAVRHTVQDRVGVDGLHPDTIEGHTSEDIPRSAA
jgi:hypothetical protein